MMFFLKSTYWTSSMEKGQMDMKRNRSRRGMNKKLMTLKATAAAVMTLNSGVVSAVTCPSIISSSIPGVCTFDTSLSVTVANGGSVQGIDMNNYQPSSSFITIDTGGTITGGSDAISITGGSVLSGSISNSGSLHGNGTGIVISGGSTVGGGISNSGSIIGGSHGISVFTGSTVSGGITNNGTISAGTTAGIGLISATVNGGMANNGSISGSQVGISIDHSVLNGGLSNTGSITGTGGGGVGIALYTSSSLAGGISNAGTITGDSVSGQSIATYTSSITGGISNSGQLNAFTGVRIDAGSSISGDISNSGMIKSNYAGVAVFHTSTITGNISNAGEILGETNAASEFGIAIQTHSVVDGSISNSGSMNVTDAGIGLYNSSHAAGNIGNNGVINSAGAGIILTTNATAANGISNSGTINGTVGIGVYNGATVTGDISNSGTIHGGTGIGVSSATISGSISNSGTIQGGTNAVFISANSAVNGFDIIGQHARLIGNVVATGTAVNITSGALFTSEGTFNVDTFNIAAGAVFNMANEITAAGGVHNAGTLSIASGTLQTIAGNYTQGATGAYQMGAASASNYGQLHVTSQASLAASGAINVQLQPNSLFHKGDVLKNVISGSTFVAPTNGYTVTDNSFIYQFMASTNTTNGVDLSIAMNPSAYLACRGSYCAGASSAILGQLANGNATFAPYAAVPTASAFATVASQATPELTNENLQITQLVARTVIDVLPMWSTLRGISAGDAMLTQPGKIWFKPYGGSATQNQRNTVDGYTASVYGLIVGGDVGLPQDWMLGGAVAAGGENLNGKAVLSPQSIHSAQYQAMIYTSKLLPHHTYFAAQALGGYGDNNTKRYVPLYTSSAKGNYHSWFADVSAQLGWSHALNNCLVITPAVTASYLYINQGSYNEYGSPMDLNVRSNNNSSFVVGADANIAYRAGTFGNQQDLTITGHAGVDYDVLHNQPSTISTFAAGGPSFSTYGIQYSGAAFRGGIGLALANPTKPLSFNLNGDVQAGNNGYNTVYTATIQYKL